MIPAQLARWLAAGDLNLPLPGRGDTARRWRRLAELTELDVVAGRLAEAHCDAAAILADLDGPQVRAGELWGVWAAESRDAVLRAQPVGDGFALHGTKVWCSGAGLCTHALVTARVDDDTRALFAVDLRHHRVRPLPSSWRNPGMAGSDTRSVQFSGVPAIAVGEPGEYLRRPGFWHGAIGVAACWLGGARAVAAPLYSAATGEEPHTLAHLGAVDAALTAASATLAQAAVEVDADPDDKNNTAELTARRCRAVVETAVEEVLTRTGRALGPAPLSQDAAHARHVADLTVYVRQSHAERDLEALGRLAGKR
ncbi:acyl-CoA dehydrogenase family protein [Mycobacterium manitobense]|uniref:Acyl-CoA dehydrogenase family protein n=1 Tax=[Mycobacterium] manitobense TaxID=190147 RepID=A0A9X3BPZ0_9MYCO|nr:acyl-CoA dehydrogenase family protein [[Mycobacterium] manitobense]MCV7172620.1 acyl-CoA dehydrogenase family protein [[Mycobacterium] manitobense]